TYYSNWTGPVRIYLCDTTSAGPGDDTTSTGPGDDTLAVASPGDLDRLTQLIPNPANEEVRVVSSVGLQSVEVLDMKGQSLLRRETHSESTVIDVKQWASGVYIVIVRTPAGIATKKLVVSERP
ncbi:MAG: T9SS type A sorting domain-containing protein, partial [Bacteroidales bacterium]|nr:T9SS type A sorting domain-containing protein [Bacteroidales bacterium]